jgi:rubrerythrin
LKTGFTAEAVTAARYRAFAASAERDGLPHLAAHWRRLAEEKDRLAIAQLEAAGQVRGAGADLGAAIAEERYENEVLYPKMEHDVDGDTAGVFASVIAAQRGHFDRLVALRDRFNAAGGDVEPPASGAGTDRK